MDNSMKDSLISNLLQFSIAKKTIGEQAKYIGLSLFFYFFLLNDNAIRTKSNDANSSSQAGDDIYPLF